MLLLIDIFRINKGRGYENPSLEIIVTEHCSTRLTPRRGLWTLLFESKCYFCCCSYIISVLLWRLCWLYYCYSFISSILFMFCILFISGILQVVSDHFPWQKLWDFFFFFRVETYFGVFKPQRSVVTRIKPRLRDSYTQEIQVVLKRTSIGHPCNPCWYPLEW